VGSRLPLRTTSSGLGSGVVATASRDYREGSEVLALAGSIGAERAWTVSMISLLSMLCR
jgi:hypothetical protein